MSDDYTHDDLTEEMETLRRIGLIEVVGITPDGQWLWGPTKAALEMTTEERASAIYSSFMDGEDDER